MKKITNLHCFTLVYALFYIISFNVQEENPSELLFINDTCILDCNLIKCVFLNFQIIGFVLILDFKKNENVYTFNSVPIYDTFCALINLRI